MRPCQPYFAGQPAAIRVCRGYAPHPVRDGNAMCKVIIDCSGREILRELLSQRPMDDATAARVMASATCMSCAMP